ncbi:hypothetical protein A0H76_2778 [Hepatospora eriocheir]|uniref:Uncharacterized protein n=1 Tax=Hepatospora eriocheir TaxID=1081669 RepID=A0A1X0QJD4_9MICR|nr:hypothetical protein A0H76_2778 [Hepatospora eriocheir]
MIVVLVFCIIIRLFASDYHIQSITRTITGGFLIYELLISIKFILSFESLNKDYTEQGNEPFVDNFINFLKIYFAKSEGYLYIITFLNEYLGNYLVDCLILFYCLNFVEFLIYIIIYVFSNRLISIDKSLVFLVLAIMSFKTCFKSFFDDKDMFVYFKITMLDIFYLITYTVLFFLSSFVKHVRDILVNIILSVFYSIILSLFISFIYYEADDFFNRLKLLLLDEDVLENEEVFTIFKEKFSIEFIFMGCFIFYVIAIFLTKRLFWKKKTVI